MKNNPCLKLPSLGPGKTAGMGPPGLMRRGRWPALQYIEEGRGDHIGRQERAWGYDHLVKEMDMSGKVEPIFQKYVQERSRRAVRTNQPCPAVSGFVMAKGAPIPEFIEDVLSCISSAHREYLLRQYSEKLRTVKRSDMERSIKIFTKGHDVGTLSENDIFQLFESIFKYAAACTGEWVFLPQARQVAAVTMGVARAQEPVSVLDKLDFL